MAIDAEVAVLKSDVSRITLLIEKLDTAIEKMGDTSNTIAQLLAVHEEKINKNEEVEEELFRLLEQRRGEMQIDIKEMHSRITTVSRELADDINDTEQRLMTALTYGLSDVKKCITDEYKANREKQELLEARVSDLEKWRWVILGGSIMFSAFAHEIITFLAAFLRK